MSQLFNLSCSKLVAPINLAIALHFQYYIPGIFSADTRHISRFINNMQYGWLPLFCNKEQTVKIASINTH